MKEQKDTDLLKESIDLVSKAEELAFKTSITDRQSLSNQFFRLKNRLGALKHKSKVKEQREFKNKDFHVKVWQSSEKIGIETVWVRKGYSYADGIWISRSISTVISNYGTLPNFGMEIPTAEILKKPNTDFYSRVVKELEKAHKLSSEVSIYDVIEECKGVTDKDELNEICSEYEFILKNGTAYPLESNKDYLDRPITFIQHGYQLRLKEQK